MIIEKVCNLPFPVETIFDAWISPDTLIDPITRIEIDPVEGGYIKLFLGSPDHITCIRGEFRRVISNERLIFSWECDGDGEVTEVDLMFAATDEGTRLRLLHTGFQKALSVAMHDYGWDEYFLGLTDFLKARR